MRIVDGIIYFDSCMPFFWKEYTGKKNNTVRTITREEEDKYKIIVNNKTGHMSYVNESGVRELVTDICITMAKDSTPWTDVQIMRALSDVSKWADTYIFTFDHLVVK